MDGRRLAERQGRGLNLQLGSHPIVERVLDLTGVLATWRVYRTRAEAVTAAARHLESDQPPAAISA